MSKITIHLIERHGVCGFPSSEHFIANGKCFKTEAEARKAWDEPAPYAALLQQNGFMKTALQAAKEKLQLYRAEHSGNYIGGIEYTDLIRMIDAALK